MHKAAAAFRTISEVSNDLNVPKHVLRFWESKFPQVKPMKRGGGRRYYRPEDIGLLRGIRHLLHAEGYTIKGVQKILREQGIETVKNITPGAKDVEQKKSTNTAPRKRRGRSKGARGGEAGPAPTAKSIARANKLEVISNPNAIPRDVERAILGAIEELKNCRTLLITGPQLAATSSRRRGTRARAAR